MSVCCIFFICCLLGDGLVIYLWCTCGLWWTCDGLVDLFRWTWALIIIYVIYIVMDVICADGCVDGWDIYVMDEIYMWYMFVWIYLSWWNVKKKSKIIVLGHFAECHGHSTQQSWKNGRSENRFSSFAECQDHGTRQRFFKKKIQTLPSARQKALGKEFF